MSTKFKVGDKVFSASHGWGVVMDIEGGGEYPVTVESLADDSDLSVYTKDGRFYTGKGAPVSLFLENEVPDFYKEKEETEQQKTHNIVDIYVTNFASSWVVSAKNALGKFYHLMLINENTLECKKTKNIPPDFGFKVDGNGSVIFENEENPVTDLAKFEEIFNTAECGTPLQKPANHNCAVLSMEEYARLLEIEAYAEKFANMINK